MEIGVAIKRLAFIKYLFIIGLEQTEKPEPLTFFWNIGVKSAIKKNRIMTIDSVQL